MYSVIRNAAKAGIVIAATMFATTAFSQSIPDSDIKKNVTPISNPLESINKLEPKVFEYDQSKYQGLKLPAGKQYGFLAENVQAVFPDMVKVESRSIPFGKNTTRTAQVKTLDTERLVPVLVASIQELQAQVEQLKAEIQQLKKAD
ncbi:MAG: tail fiber domain-containing protein [Chitinophagaceae bacterium]